VGGGADESVVLDVDRPIAVHAIRAAGDRAQVRDEAAVADVHGVSIAADRAEVVYCAVGPRGEKAGSSVYVARVVDIAAGLEVYAVDAGAYRGFDHPGVLDIRVGRRDDAAAPDARAGGYIKSVVFGLESVSAGVAPGECLGGHDISSW
jgi:hypothetical protein